MGRRKQTMCDRLRSRGPKMLLHPAPTGRHIVYRASAATQTRRKYAARLRLCRRCAVAPSVRSLTPRDSLAATLYEGHRFRGQCFRGQRLRVCAAAFVFNVATACSMHTLASGG
jgi:hypothetical protein